MCIIFKMFISYANLLVQHLADRAGVQKLKVNLCFFTRNYAKVFREREQGKYQAKVSIVCNWESFK